MIVVLDASAAAKIVIQTAEQKLLDVIPKADVVIAPDLFLAEISNVFWKYHQFNQLPLAECEFLIDQAVQLVDDFISAKDLYKESFALAVQTGCTVYDSLYLVLSRRRAGYLATADKRLHKIARKNAIKVIVDLDKA